MKKIVYLGGFYPAEHSMWHSFTEHGASIVFPFDSPYRFKEDEKVLLIPDFLTLVWLSEYKPDLIVHRFYKNYPCMHGYVGEMARQLGIPYIVYRMETWPRDEESSVISPVECDLFLYANPCDVRFLPEMDVPVDYWPWGVSSFERNMNIERSVPVGAFGNLRPDEQERMDSLRMFVWGTMCHRGTQVSMPWDTLHESIRDLAPAISLDGPCRIPEQTERMNRCRVALNYESLSAIPGCYSYKMFQTLGCGTPTITSRKPEFREMFEGALVEIEDGIDVAIQVRRLLEDKEEWARISALSERVVHEKFEWFENFDRIMRKHNLW